MVGEEVVEQTGEHVHLVLGSGRGERGQRIPSATTAGHGLSQAAIILPLATTRYYSPSQAPTVRGIGRRVAAFGRSGASNLRYLVRCLREGLHLSPPPADVPLDELDHPLLAKAREQFAAPDAPHERIRSIDDVVPFKVKIGRWCGATYVDRAATEARGWVVAAGFRPAGCSRDQRAAAGR